MNRRCRVIAYFAFILSIPTFISLRSASAEIGRASFAIGRDLLPISDLLGERAKVNLNGEHIWASSTLVPASVHEVLDRFETHCREAGVTGNLGVLRNEQAEEGVVLCFLRSDESSFVRRVQAFLDTHDLGELGRLRYAYVRRSQDVSHVLAIWSEDHLQLDKLAGTDGSEPGSDHPDLPRPIRSRRTVSTSIEGTAYGAHGYLSQATSDEVLAVYTNEMTSRGWKTATTADQSIRGYTKDGSLVTIGVESTPEGTVIGIAEIGADPSVMPLTGDK